MLNASLLQIPAKLQIPNTEGLWGLGNGSRKNGDPVNLTFENPTMPPCSKRTTQQCPQGVAELNFMDVEPTGDGGDSWSRPM